MSFSCFGISGRGRRLSMERPNGYSVGGLQGRHMENYTKDAAKSGFLEAAGEISRRDDRSVAEQRCEARPNLVNRGSGATSEMLSAPCPPIHAFQVVCPNHAHRVAARRDLYLKRVPFRLVCHRADQGKTGFEIVRFRAEYQRRTTLCLFAASLWVEHQPDKIAQLGDVRSNYQESSPCNGAQRDPPHPHPSKSGHPLVAAPLVQSPGECERPGCFPILRSSSRSA